MKTSSDIAITQFTILWQHADLLCIYFKLGQLLLKIGSFFKSILKQCFCHMMDNTEQFLCKYLVQQVYLSLPSFHYRYKVNI